MIETSKVFQRILKMLEESKVEYDLIVHQPVYTSQEAAEIRDGMDMHSGAKSILFSADGITILCVVPGDRKINTNKFKREYPVNGKKIRDLRMLTADQVTKQTGLEIGSIPPMGCAMDVTTYVDSEVLENEWMVFNAGSHTQSVRMKVADYVKLCDPTEGIFSK